MVTQPLTQPPSEDAKAKRSSLMTLGYIFSLMAGVLIGTIGMQHSANATRAAAPTTTITLWATDTITRTVSPTAQPVAAEPRQASKSFYDGTKLVGKDIEPGTYRSNGGSMCYWARLAGLSGGLEDILANDFGSGGQQVVEILPTDMAFKSTNCGRWAQIG